jgi:hypothetical protein
VNEIVESLDAEMAQIDRRMKDPKLCEDTLDVQTRVSGYYRSVVNFNPGKKQEYLERNEYAI